MNWRVFQLGFIFGFVLAAYSQYTGATGFKTMADLVCAGFLFGILIDALWWAQVALCQQYRHS